jgi:3-methyladenine DNA glycosylase AlkD
MNPVLAKIREELEAGADEKTRMSFQRFFKEEVTYYGVKTGTVAKIAKKHWSEVKLFSKQKIFAFCEELLRSDYTEEVFVASFWLPNLAEQLEPSD